jgi:hypothetical protein
MTPTPFVNGSVNVEPGGIPHSFSFAQGFKKIGRNQNLSFPFINDAIINKFVGIKYIY